MNNNENIALVAASKSGLIIIDLNDIQNPHIIGKIETYGVAYEVVLSNNDETAFLADSFNGVEIINIRETTKPILVSN